MWKIIGHFWLFTYGWKAVQQEEVPEKCVIVAAPHTSNWDLPFTVGVGGVLQLRIKWLGKHTLFKFPWKTFMLFLGGISVDRRGGQNYVEKLAERFKKSKRFRLVMSPEATRSKSELWKSGFFHIAKAADVPIVLAYLDYGRKQGGLGPVIYPVDDMESVMAQIRDFYRDVRGFDANAFGEIKLRGEIQTDAVSSEQPQSTSPAPLADESVASTQAQQARR